MRPSRRRDARRSRKRIGRRAIRVAGAKTRTPRPSATRRREMPSAGHVTQWRFHAHVAPIRTRSSGRDRRADATIASDATHRVAGNASKGVRSAWLVRRHGLLDRRRHAAERCVSRVVELVAAACVSPAERRCAKCEAEPSAARLARSSVSPRWRRSAKRKAEPLPRRRAGSRHHACVARSKTIGTALSAKRSPPRKTRRWRVFIAFSLRCAHARLNAKRSLSRVVELVVSHASCPLTTMGIAPWCERRPLALPSCNALRLSVFAVRSRTVLVSHPANELSGFEKSSVQALGVGSRRHRLPARVVRERAECVGRPAPSPPIAMSPCPAISRPHRRARRAARAPRARRRRARSAMSGVRFR